MAHVNPSSSREKSMPDLPYLALKIVSRFLSPYQLLTLAQVNKNWYTAFTSDEAWEDWDVFGLGHSVYSHYLASKPDFSEGEWHEAAEQTELGEFTNWYSLLNRIRTGALQGELLAPENKALKIAPRSFCRALCQRKWKSELYFDYLPAMKLHDEEIVCGLLERGMITMDLPSLFRTNRKVFLASLDSQILSEEQWETIDFDTSLWEDRDLTLVFDFEQLFQDREFAFTAIKACKGIYFRFPDPVQADPAVFNFQFEHWKAELETQCEDDERWVLPLLTDWLPPRDVLENKSQVLFLAKSFRHMIGRYSFLCERYQIMPDVDLIHEALEHHPCYKTGSEVHLPHLPTQLMAEKDFLLKLLDEYAALPSWNLISRDLRKDSDVLGVMLAKLQRFPPFSMGQLYDGWQRLYAVAQTGIGTSWVKVIANMDDFEITWGNLGSVFDLAATLENREGLREDLYKEGYRTVAMDLLKRCDELLESNEIPL